MTFSEFMHRYGVIVMVGTACLFLQVLMLLRINELHNRVNYTLDSVLIVEDKLDAEFDHR